MKYLMILTIGVGLLLSSVPVVADQAADEAAIREVIEQAFAMANKHDAKALMSLCTEDFEGWTGERKGRAAWEEFLSDHWGRQKDFQYELIDEIGLIFVAPNVAIHKYHERTTGLLDADGKPLPERKRLVAYVYVKKDGKWMAATFFARPIEE